MRRRRVTLGLRIDGRCGREAASRAALPVQTNACRASVVCACVAGARCSVDACAACHARNQKRAGAAA